MDQASALIDGLSGEKIRWTDQLAAFKAETERLVGDVVLLVGFLGYSGPFNQEFRMAQQEFWMKELVSRKIPVTPNLSITESLIDTATVRTSFHFVNKGAKDLVIDRRMEYPGSSN